MISRGLYLMADPLGRDFTERCRKSRSAGIGPCVRCNQSDDAAFQVYEALRDGTPDVRTTTLSIAGMSCGACVRHVTRALDGMTGVVHAQVDLRTNEAIVEHIPAYVQAAALIGAVGDAGYEAGIVRTVDDRDVMARRPEVSSACGCGCCGGKPKTTVSAGWPGLGTDTIG